MQVVMDLGEMPLKTPRIPLVAKMPRRAVGTASGNVTGAATQTHHLRMHDKLLSRSAELSATYFQRRGFPVPLMHAVPFGEGYVLVSENLKGEGRVLSEADGFDFSGLRNGKKLQKRLGAYLRRLQGMNNDNEISVTRHVTGADNRTAFKHAFFVDWNQRTKNGRLIMGDLDHIQLKLNEAQWATLKKVDGHIEDRVNIQRKP